MARQNTAQANDKALTLEERRLALGQLQEAARVFVASDEVTEAARTLNRVGRLQLIINEPEKAIAAHRQAIRLLKKSPSITVEIDNLNGLAAALMRKYNLREAEAALQRSILLSESSGYLPGRAEALVTLSERQNNVNHVQAAQTAESALMLWQSANDAGGRARAHYQLGECYLAQNMLPEAGANYEAALQIWRDLDDSLGQATNLIALGFIEFRKGDWEKDISYLTQAQGLIDEQAEPGKMSQIAGGLAEAFNESGLPEQGLFHFHRMLDYSRQLRDPIYIGYAYWGLGWTYYLLGNYSAAMTQFDLALAQDDSEGLLAAQCHELLGRVHFSVGDYSKALQYLRLALDTYLKAGNPREEAQTRAMMGRIYQLQGQHGPAMKYYQQALATFVRLSDRLNEAAVYFALGELELKDGRYDAAEKYLAQSIAATENVRKVSSSRDLTTAFSAAVHARYRAYIECLMQKQRQQPEQNLAVRAFEMNELALARSLAELLRATETKLAPGVDPKLATQEKALRQALRVKEDARVSLLGRAYQKEELNELDAEVARLETQYDQVRDSIKKRYPSYEQMTRPDNWSLAQIQEKVIADNDTVLLEYSLGRETSYVWVVTRDQIHSYELPSQKVIQQSVHKVYGELSGSASLEAENNLARAADELGQMVLTPIYSHLNKQRLIVVADDALNYIPFQILAGPSGKPLVASHEVINVPSASILGQLRIETERRQEPTITLAAFGDPVFASNYAQSIGATGGELLASIHDSEVSRWQHAVRDIETTGDNVDASTIQPLFYSKLELANLREVAGPESFVVTGFDATREKLEQAELGKYSILHFATHGILDPKRPENSGLFLSMVDRKGQAQNGFIGLEDIYRLKAPVDLVVLSACRTGLGKDVRGEGLVGLTRGFMYAGASSVIASLWKVDDQATAELMKRFYANLLQRGMKPAAALRDAQNSIRQQPEWRSPHFWAAFTLQGEYNKVIAPPSRSWPPRPVLITLAISLLLFAAGAWWYRRSRSVGGVATPR